MGLDNGIILAKGKKDIEVAYWRKCWLLRNDIMAAIDPAEKCEGEIKLTKKNLPDVKKVLKYYYFTIDGLLEWSDPEMCQWDDPEIRYNVKTKLGYFILRVHLMIKRRQKGKEIMRALNDAEKHLGEKGYKLYFYDSY